MYHANRSCFTPPRCLLLAAATLLFAGALGCASPKYVHAVYFTCHDGTSDAEIDALIADGHKLLGDIPTVQRVETGRRDPCADRDVNVTDYDVGLIVYFDNREGHDVYQDHPKHLEYVRKHKPNWTQVRVCDFVTE
jgi:hypothetical protein